MEAISESYGRDFIPHPFAHIRPSPFTGLDGYTKYANDLLDRVNHGDLGELKKWFSSYVGADLRVECAIGAVSEPGGRLVAHRCGEVGYLAIQQPDEDTVKIYAVPPQGLGAAIAGSVGLTKPGKHAKILIPELAPAAPRRDVTGPVSILAGREPVHDGVVVSQTQIARFGRVQSRWQPARNWGFDRQKKAVVWVRIDDDGDYIYAPGFTHLTPATARELMARVDQLIAEDVAAIREARSAHQPGRPWRA
ncbi:ESX secretion-associated protein EspG [Mycobacterium talmoniae]|uniref:ESX secretion-associated protein EspG n=1 Tax=Mycobacterium talmoniae TaxID=1858794 RepID=A0A1S1NLD2_9MYCO|nr:MULTISPECIES: ESX secretion-associated protein EspG [Mycobacterium]OHV04674.1 hypothetical protein BKN37_08880 [Mycobacterium talmoniae]PQM49650.1 hypothetical protein C1Y40_00116 [Mycobacterium talmoniae]TDH49295.1 hypothetical protein E2F47_21020 [Mycobacterium eburneum]